MRPACEFVGRYRRHTDIFAVYRYLSALFGRSRDVDISECWTQCFVNHSFFVHRHATGLCMIHIAFYLIGVCRAFVNQLRSLAKIHGSSVNIDGSIGLVGFHYEMVFLLLCRSWCRLLSWSLQDKFVACIAFKVERYYYIQRAEEVMRQFYLLHCICGIEFNLARLSDRRFQVSSEVRIEEEVSFLFREDVLSIYSYESHRVVVVVIPLVENHAVLNFLKRAFFHLQL